MPTSPTPKELSRGFELSSDCHPSRCQEKYSNLREDVFFTFAPNLSNGAHHGRQEWAAALWLYTTDIPRLMREGLHWTGENIVPEYGACLTPCKWKLTPETKVPGNAFAVRRCLLVDRSKECRWSACLLFVAPEGRLDVLDHVRVSDLHAGNVELCKAGNWEGELVYQYNYFFPNERINCVYEGLPLAGKWPWPKREEAKEDTESPDPIKEIVAENENRERTDEDDLSSATSSICLL